MNTTVEPVSGVFGDESFFDHVSAVREMELKHMSTGFDVKPNKQLVFPSEQLIVMRVIIFQIDGYPESSSEQSAIGIRGEILNPDGRAVNMWWKQVITNVARLSGTIIKCDFMNG